MGAKRVVVDKNQGSKKDKTKKKKKKSCCLTCFLVFLITSIVLFAALVGVGCYVGNIYTTQYLGMSIGECFQVVGGLYSPKEKKIVTNAYDEEKDLDAFEAQLKHAVFLKEDTEIDYEEILELALSGLKKSENNAGSRADGDVSDGEISSGDEESGEFDAITSFVAELFKKENIDFERLENYDESKHSDYLMKISDKGVAAFINEILGIVLKGDTLKDLVADSDGANFDLSEYGIDDITQIVKLRQIILDKQTRAVTITDEDGERHADTKEVTMLTATVQVKLIDAAKCVLDKFIGKSILSSMALLAVRPILPNNLYLTVGIGLDYETDIVIKLNNIDDEKKLALTYKLLDNINKDSDKSFKDTINETVREALFPTIKSVTDFADLSKVKDGTLEVDLFATVIDSTGINDDAEPGQEITSKELLSTLGGILGSDYKNAIDPVHTYKNQYKSTASDTEYNEKYGTVYDPAVKDETKLVDYENECLNEIAEKYALNLDPDGTPGSGDEIEFADLMAMFGVGSSDTQPVLTDLIKDSKDKLSELLGEKFENLRVVINDRMMGAILSATMDNILQDNDFASYDLEVEQVIISTSTGAVNRQFIEMGLSAGISSLFSEVDGSLASILSAFLPERIMLSVKLDITRGLGDGEYAKTEIKYNDLTAQRTENVLKVIGKFAGSLDIDNILEQIETPVRDMLNTMYETIGSVRFEDSALVLPDIFTTISDMLFKDENGSAVATGEEIRDVLKGLDGSDDEGFVESLGVSAPAANYQHFADDIKGKYYIKGSEKADTFDEIFNLVDITGFKSDRFDIDELQHDKRAAEELKPFISDGELAKIFADAIEGNAALPTGAEIVGIHVGTTGEGRQYIRIAAKFKLDKLGDDISSIIPIKDVYIVATSFVDKPQEGTNDCYETTIAVNKMTPAELGTLQRMLKHLNVDTDFDEIRNIIGENIFKQLNTLHTSLGEDGFEFVDGGIELIDFYDFLAKATKVSADGETIKGAVQGLYERKDSGDSDYNFTQSNIVGNTLGTLDDREPQNNFEEFDILRGKARMSDKKFAALLAGQFNKNDVGELKELTIVSSLSGEEKTKKYYDEMKALGVTSPDGKNYMRLVVDVELQKLLGDNTSDIMTFLPTHTMITMYISLDGEMHCDVIRINSLTASQQKVLFDIANLDSASVQKTVDDSLEIVDKYHNNASYVDSTTDGVGAIYTDMTKLQTSTLPIAA